MKITLSAPTVLAAVVMTVAATLIGCTASPDGETVTVDSTTSSTSSTTALAETSTTIAGATGPLAARTNALGVWTGSEVLIIGGDPEAWCPPDADCSAPDFSSLTDSAAIDPATEQWRRLAPAPAPVNAYSDSVLSADGNSVYVLTRPLFTASDRTEPAFMAYDIAGDTWTLLSLPPDTVDVWPTIVALDGGLNGEADESILAYLGTHELGTESDQVFDPATGTWSELPADPLGPSFDRFVAPVGDELLLFAKDLVDNPGSNSPSLASMARFDTGTSEWTEIGEAEVLWTDSGVVVGDRIVFPHSGSSDGGQVNNWGRSIAHGGVYDTANGQWTPLPDGAGDGALDVGGVISADGSDVWSINNSLVDLDAGAWRQVRLGSDKAAEVTGRTVVATDSQIVVFGGEIWESGEGRVLDDFAVIDLN